MKSYQRIAEWLKKNRIISSALFMLVVLALFLLVQNRAPRKTDRVKFYDRIPVSVALVTKAAVRDSFSTTGTVEAFREAEIFSESGGLVRRVSSEPGEHKLAGAELFVIDDELPAAQMRRAEARYRKSELDFERYKILYREGAVALSMFETVQLQRDEAKAEWISDSRKYRNTRIKAPFSGVVTSRSVEQGEMVHEGLKVAHMVDMSKVKIIIYVPERQIMKFPPGTPLSVTSDLYPGERFTGRVGSMSDKAGRDHTYRVEVWLLNPGKAVFRSGMFARVLYSGAGEREAVLVPRAALVSGIRTPEVFVISHGRVSLRHFVAGMEQQKHLEVLGGLSPGDSVVISGQNELQDGTEVTVISRKNSPDGPP